MKKVNENVENSTNEVVKEVVNLDSLKAELKAQAEKMAQVKEELKQKMAELKEQAKRLKEEETSKKKELKAQEARERAQRMKVVLEKAGAEITVNKTQKIKELLLEGKTTDEIVELTGFGRKEILDRIWLIEKKLGIR